MNLKRTVQATIYPDDESGYVAECRDLHAVTQGDTLDEAVTNLRAAIALALDGEDLAALGLAERPVILITIEVEPAVA